MPVRIAAVWMATMNHIAKTWAVTSARNAWVRAATILTGVPWAAWENPAGSAVARDGMSRGVPWVAWDTPALIVVAWMVTMNLGAQATAVWAVRCAVPVATIYAHAIIPKLRGNVLIAMAVDILTGPMKIAMFAMEPAYVWIVQD